jgi:hypothetical protein
MRSLRLLSFALLVLAFLPTVGQTNVNEEQGLKPYDAWHGGDLDSVSMTSGGLSLHIPLLSYPQRGNLDLSFSIFASSKQWRTRINTTACTSQNPPPNACTPLWIPTVRGLNQPQFGAVPVEGAYVTSSLDWIPDNECNFQFENPDNGGVSSYTWFAGIVAPDGNIHSFGSGFSTTSCPNPPFRALDASGIFQPDTSNIVFPNGTRFNFGSTANTYTDSNGNQITLTSQTYTDTLGRQVPVPFMVSANLDSCPAGSVSAKTWSVPGYAGANRFSKPAFPMSPFLRILAKEQRNTLRRTHRFLPRFFFLISLCGLSVMTTMET